MFEYFLGWKRKTGLVTLVTACLCAVAWMRSIFYEDVLQITIPDRFGGVHAFESSRSVFSWSRVCLPPWEPGKVTWDSVRIGHRRQTVILDLFPQFEQALESNPSRQWNVPYWLVVLPVSLVSASLLLSKRGQPTKLELSQEPAA